MPIVMTVSFRLHADKRDEALAAALRMETETTREPGCSAYRFWTAVDDPNTLGLFELWDSQDALDAHLKTAHMAAFGHAMVPVVDQQASMTRYEIASFSSYSASDDA